MSLEISEIKQEYSRVVPLNKLLWLLLLSASVYQYYWYYSTMKLIKDHENSDINVGLRTFLLFVPIANLLVIYSVYRSINKINQKYFFYSHSFNPILLILIQFSVIIVYLLPPQIHYLAICNNLVLVYAQYKLNEIWKQVDDSKDIDNIPSMLDIIFIIIGLVLWFIMFKYYFKIF